MKHTVVGAGLTGYASLQKLLYAAASLLLNTAATAQRVAPSIELRDFSKQRIRHQQTLGLALGSYALANIAVGSMAAGLVRPSGSGGEKKYFHRMNVYWDLFNLSIAGAGFLLAFDFVSYLIVKIGVINSRSGPFRPG